MTDKNYGVCILHEVHIHYNYYFQYWTEFFVQESNITDHYIVLCCHHKVGPEAKIIHSKENLLLQITLEKRTIKIFRQREQDLIVDLRKNPGLAVSSTVSKVWDQRVFLRST